MEADPTAGHHPAEDIASQLVRAERVRTRGREQLGAGDVLGVDIVGRQRLAEQGQEEEPHHDDDAEQVEPVADQEASQVAPELTLSTPDGCQP